MPRRRRAAAAVATRRCWATCALCCAPSAAPALLLDPLLPPDAGVAAGGAAALPAHGSLLLRPRLSSPQPPRRAARVSCSSDSSAVAVDVALCRRRGARPCFRDEVCPGGVPVRRDGAGNGSADLSYVVVGDGCAGDAPNLVDPALPIRFTAADWRRPRRVPLRWDPDTVASGEVYAVRCEQTPAAGGRTCFSKVSPQVAGCKLRGRPAARVGVAAVHAAPGAGLRMVDASRRPLPRLRALSLPAAAGHVGFGVEVTAPPSAEPGPLGWAAAASSATCSEGAHAAGGCANLIDCALSPPSPALALLRPAAREVAAGGAARVLWFVVRRMEQQFSEYSARVTCRQVRLPDDRTDTVWELHPDHASVSRDIRVEPPAPESYASSLAVSLPQGDEVPVGAGSLPIGLALRRPGAGPAKVRCAVDPPGGTATFAGAVAAPIVASPLRSGDRAAFNMAPTPSSRGWVLFKWLGPADAGPPSSGARWLGCPLSAAAGGAGGGACALTECAGAAFEGAEWGQRRGACAEAHFRVYAARSAADAVAPLWPRHPVRQGDALIVVQTGLERGDGWPLREHVSCDAAGDAGGTACRGGHACLSQLPPLNGTDWGACPDHFRLWAVGRALGET
eukprot:gene22048-5297_t